MKIEVAARMRGRERGRGRERKAFFETPRRDEAITTDKQDHLRK